jgi:hypothetical protein
MAKNKQKDTCLACNKAFTKSDASIQCVICTLWIHHKPCSSVSDEGFKFLSDHLQATGTAYWACRSCIRYSQGITQRVRDMEKKLEDVHQEVKENTKGLEKVDKTVSDLKKDLDKVKETRKEETSQFITAEEYREREARRFNLIMHRVPESAGNTGEDRKRADQTTCNNILEAIGLRDWASDIKLCRRLGERGDEPRPLIVYLRTETTRTAILEAAKHLRNTPFNEISIVPDLTPAQRQEEAALSVEMDRRNKEELTEEDRQKNLQWRVVGPRGARRIIKTTARDWQPPTTTRGRGRGRGRGRPAAARTFTCRQPQPAAAAATRPPTVPQPTGNGQPTIRPITLLPPPETATRKRSRDAATARPRGPVTSEDGTGEEDEEEEEVEDMEDETRSPASKR